MTACPFCQSPFEQLYRFAKLSDPVEDGAVLVDNGGGMQPHMNPVYRPVCNCELARIKTERDEWRAVAESRLGECACIGEYKCGRCQSLTAYNNLKNPTK